MKTRRALLGISVVSAAVLLAGCGGGPYRIRESASADSTYYAKSFKRQKDGTISFTDARTGAKVTLQSSVVEEIPRDEWRGAVND